MLNAVGLAFALCAGSLGAIALVGWLFGIELLERAVVSAVPIKVNGAVSLILLSFAVLARRDGLSAGWRRAGAAAALVTAILAGATMAEYLFGWRLGIDQLVLRDRVRPGAPYPGRPSFNAALGFALLAGCALAADLRVGRWWLSHLLAGAAGALGLLALVGVATGSTSLADLATGQAISVPAAVGLVLLAGAVLLAHLDRGVAALFSSPGAGGVLLRRLWPFALAVPIALAALRLAGQNAGLYGDRDGEWLYASAVTAILGVFAWELARVIERGSAERGRATQALLAVSESATDAVVMADASGAIRYVNRGAEAMFGYEPGTLLGEPLALLVPAAPIAQLVAFEGPRARGATGEPAAPLLALRHDGSDLAVEASWTVTGAGGERSLTGIFREVSARSRAQDRFRALLESAPDAIVIVDDSERILLVNARTEALFGYERAELLGRPVELLVPQPLALQVDGGPPGEAPPARLIGAGRQVQGVRRDGSRFPVELSLNRIRTVDGALASIAIRDVSERTRADHARAWLAAIVESSSEAVVGVSGGGLIESWNAGAERLYGWSAAEAVGSPITMLVAPELAAERARRHAALMAGTEEVVDWETEDVTSDGRRIDVAITVSAIRDPTGTIVGVARIARDIGDRKRLEQAQTLDAVGQLAGGIAHDFNNLLTVVSGYARRLRAREDLAGAFGELDQIVSASDRAADLTKQLLTFARRGERTPELLDVNDTIRSLEPMLRRLIDADILFDVELDRSLAAVMMDRTELEHILMNLIINASHAMSDGGSLTVATWPRAISAAEASRHAVAPGDAVSVSVADTGVGMVPEIRGRIFEPFFTTKAEKGTGMGLATVYGIVRQAGGWIDVETELGVGTTFWVILPAAGAAPAPAPAPARAPDDAADRTGEHPTLLLVEDEAPLRALVVTMLEEQGYNVLAAGNGPDAVSLAERHRGPVDLLITDVVMPRLSGPELARQLREMWPGLAVLYVSGYSDNRLLSRGVEDGEVNLLVKPFTPIQLFDRVRALTPVAQRG